MAIGIYKSGWKSGSVGGVHVFKSSAWKDVAGGYVYRSGWKQFYIALAPALTAFVASKASGGTDPCSDPLIFDITWEPNAAVSDGLHHLRTWFSWSIEGGAAANGDTASPASVNSRNGLDCMCGTGTYQNMICNYELQLDSDHSVIASGSYDCGKVSMQC